MWLLYAFLSAITAASVAIFAKLGLGGIDSTLATTIRSIIMAGFLVLTSLFLKKFQGFSFSSLGSRDWILIVLAGIAGALSWFFYFWFFYFFALKTGLATKVVVIDRLSLVFVIILAVIFFRRGIGLEIRRRGILNDYWGDIDHPKIN
jgi:transporter family protein